MMRSFLVLGLAVVSSGLEVRSLKDVGESSESEQQKRDLLRKLRLQADARERERAAAEREIAAAKTKMEVAMSEMRAHEAELVAAHNREMVEETAKITKEKVDLEVQRVTKVIQAAKEEKARLVEE